jgi:hypothetical protein
VVVLEAKLRSVKMRTKKVMQAKLARLLVLQERNEADSSDLAEIEELRNDIKNIGKRLVMPENTSQQRSSNSSFASFGEFLIAVRNAEMPQPQD